MKLERVTVSFDGRAVLRDFSCDFAPGVTAVLGPSGVGKSTLINLLCGLVKPDSGRVTPPNGRLGVVFQEDRLLEQLSAAGNLAFVTGRGRAAEIDALLARLGLGGEGAKPVREFSGGMKRRVALARALVIAPDVLLMDEPFRGLDADTRAVAADVIGRQRVAQTVFVTHDPAEIELLHATNVIRLAAT